MEFELHDEGVRCRSASDRLMCKERMFRLAQAAPVRHAISEQQFHLYEMVLKDYRRRILRLGVTDLFTINSRLIDRECGEDMAS